MLGLTEWGTDTRNFTGEFGITAIRLQALSRTQKRQGGDTGMGLKYSENNQGAGLVSGLFMLRSESLGGKLVSSCDRFFVGLPAGCFSC
jgi:hypothetical protein